MSNGTSEWVNDWYEKDYYLRSAERNPVGPNTGTQKVLRDNRSNNMTFGRYAENTLLETYSPSHSFRCAVQQYSPLISF